MIPAGYMAKRVVVKPDWIDATQVIDIYSVSQCVSRNFADYVNYWKHNGYWLFDSPEIIVALASANGIALSGTKLYYYEIYEHEFDDSTEQWRDFAPEPSFKTLVLPPSQRHLEGFDVVTFSVHTSPECSPLSCNSYATKIPTNEHCLLSSIDSAREAVENGRFDDSEPGPFAYLRSTLQSGSRTVSGRSRPGRRRVDSGLGHCVTFCASPSETSRTNADKNG
jgi:hypothetical protein